MKPKNIKSEKIRLTQFSQTGGCGCKIAPARLRALLKQAGVLPPQFVPPALLAGAENAEDAAVWKISEECALVATADFFAPPVDSPRDFGRIAAANAISDIYAMGASPLFALALAAFPAAVADEDIAAVWAGGAEICAEAGAIIAGGHSIAAAEPLYGLAVVGRANPKKILTNGGARAGDTLILGKPLGAGLLAAARRRGELADEDYAQMTDAMTTLNRAGEKMPDGVSALTDITGFGLLGHVLEMCRASGCRAALRFSAIPFFERAQILAEQGEATGASARNWQSYGGEVFGAAEKQMQTLLTDPQTGGGLLAACAPEAAAEVLAAFHQNGCPRAAIIGEMKTGAGVVVE